jgi:hypothetical protein
MMDRIEHTEHKRRDREASHSTTSRFGEHRYGATDDAEPEAAERPDGRP